MPELIPGLGFLAQAAVVLLAFSFMIFVHELGHYLAARLVGVRVERFFIGFDVFGLSISRKIGGTVYGIGALPLGGYVALAGQNDDPRKEVITGAPDELRSRPIWAQLLVFVSGVLMNFFFGFVLLVWAYMHGIPFVPNVVGEVEPDQPAAIHGLRRGDRILNINSRPTPDFEGVHAAIAEWPVGREMRFTVARARSGADTVAATAGEDADVEVFETRIQGVASLARGNLNTVGIYPPRSRVVGGVAEPYKDAETAALFAVDDEILAVDGEPIPPEGGAMIEARLDQWPATSVPLTVRRAVDGRVEDIVAPLRTYGAVDLGFRVGVRVIGVAEDGAAAAAGLRAGEVVVAARLPEDDRPRHFRRVEDFRGSLAASALRPVDVDYLRDGREYVTRLSPRLLPGAVQHAGRTDTLLGIVGVSRSLAELRDGRVPPNDDPDSEGEGDGAGAPDAVTSMAGDFAGGDEAPRGFYVREVIGGGPADDILQPGDVIVSVANRALDGRRSLRETVEDACIAPLTLYVAAGAGGAAADADADGRDKIPPPVYGDDGLRKLTMRLRLDPRTRRPLIGVEYSPAEVVVGVEPDSIAARYLSGELEPAGAQLLALRISGDMRTVRATLAYPRRSALARSDPAAPSVRTVVLPMPADYRDDPFGHGLKRRLEVEFKAARQIDRLSLGDAVAAGGEKWCDIATMVFRYLSKLVKGDISVSAMGGPIMLFEVIKIADDRGFGYLLYVVALISINLGICNILPLPVLDGGHVAFLLYEWVTGRKPNERVREVLQWIGLALLLGLMLTVTGYDIFDWLGR